MDIEEFKSHLHAMAPRIAALGVNEVALHLTPVTAEHLPATEGPADIMIEAGGIRFYFNY